MDGSDLRFHGSPVVIDVEDIASEGGNFPNADVISLTDGSESESFSPGQSASNNFIRCPQSSHRPLVPTEWIRKRLASCFGDAHASSSSVGSAIGPSDNPSPAASSSDTLPSQRPIFVASQAHDIPINSPMIGPTGSDHGDVRLNDVAPQDRSSSSASEPQHPEASTVDLHQLERDRQTRRQDNSDSGQEGEAPKDEEIEDEEMPVFGPQLAPVEIDLTNGCPGCVFAFTNNCVGNEHEEPGPVVISGHQAMACDSCARSKRLRKRPREVIEIQDDPGHEEVVNQLWDTLTCPICMQKFSSQFSDPSSTICGHLFCHECIAMAVRTKRQCPTCRRPLDMRGFHPVFL